LVTKREPTCVCVSPPCMFTCVRVCWCVRVCECVCVCVYVRVRVCVCSHFRGINLITHIAANEKLSTLFCMPDTLGILPLENAFFLCEEKKSRVHMVCEHPNTNTSFHMSIISWISLLSHALGKAFEPQRKLLMIKPK